ncbi:MAG: sigma-70 family RNA polymerase sigma factor [Phycisphaerae bacterium]|nr:sigma-70 family RNA polymerase sigma factor [Phycisphaerae bacterium]
MSKMGRKVARAKRQTTKPPRTKSAPPPLADLDTQLMVQAREGNREAANMLIRRNFQRISRYIARLVGNNRPVEDLTQDVFLQVLNRASQYKPTAKVSTWLYRIATNTALNYLKRPSVKRRVPDPPEGALEVPDRSESRPDERMSLDEVKDQVAEAIGALPLNQRIALTLFQYEDCSYEQIAVVLDVSIEAVRSLLMRARTTLRGRLNGLI